MLNHPTRTGYLALHETLSFSHLWAGDDWPFTGSEGKTSRLWVHPSVHATCGDLLRELAVANDGISMQPTFLVAEELRRGTLVPILLDYKTMEFSLYAVYLSHRPLPSKLRAFIDYLVQNMGSEPTWVTRPGNSTS